MTDDDYAITGTLDDAVDGLRAQPGGHERLRRAGVHVRTIHRAYVRSQRNSVLRGTRYVPLAWYPERKR